MAFRWDWGISSIRIPVPPTRDDLGPSLQPPGWHELKFSPIGLYDLRRRLGAHPNEPETTLWDRAFGGTTLVLHIEGTTAPGTPAELQYLRASGYLPPSFVDAHPESHAAIANIVQLFFEAIGVPTVEQWTANAQARGWSLTQPGYPSPVNPWSPRLIPAPAAGTSHFKLFGRCIGELKHMLAINPTPSPPSPPLPLVIIPDDNEELMDALERAARAEAQARRYGEQVERLIEQVDILIDRAATAEARCAEFHRQLHAQPTPRAPPTTPAASTMCTTPRTPTRTPMCTPASHPSRPPPYTPAPNPPIPPSSINPWSSLPVTESMGDTRRSDRPDALDLFILAENLKIYAVSIRLVIHGFSVGKWYEELMSLGLSGAVVSELIDVAISLDA
ncbi:hypothetical protein K438DRAFT_1760927 [Mycena galopus ATCC 62051]|nr:hypothetical protein K438DRAFT_1760927 [Mycena galopus ATCC 62051]